MYRQVSACRHWLALPWLSELGMLTASARAIGKDVASVRIGVHPVGVPPARQAHGCLTNQWC
jgi:hypothetical protein